MKNPKFKIGNKVKVNEFGGPIFTKINGIKAFNGEFKYYTDCIEGNIEEIFFEIPTDYELGTYY